MLGVAVTSLTAGGFSGIGWKSPCASFINGSSAANAATEPTTDSIVASVAVNVRIRPSREHPQLSILAPLCSPWVRRLRRQCYACKWDSAGRAMHLWRQVAEPTGQNYRPWLPPLRSTRPDVTGDTSGRPHIVYWQIARRASQ